MQLRGSTCLVTGGSSGIGAATALALSSAGASVVVAGTDADRTAAVAARTGGRVLVADLREPGAAARLAADAGPLDVLVNNAGVGWSGEFAEMPPERIPELVALDLTAAMLLTREVLPGMAERGRGHVVNIGSIAGAAGGRGEAVYAACKAGLAGFTEALRQEHASGPIDFSLIVPGAVATAFFERRGTPYDRAFPRPVNPGRVAVAVRDAILERRAEVVVPAWLGVAMRVRGAAPELYRPLADRFG
ncbi:MAG TPA: SDR family NAD(P)-dependent oxidoreductase [Gaiellales bacterium]|nr:SDR family NAD(P)-dependent oxidoreductase [Gaiellales bacterium]